MAYNTEYIVKYTNNQEYRICIRELSGMNTNSDVDFDIDEETQDEQNYDMDAMCKLLDYVYSITETNVYFQKLFKYGAATMLSEDPSIGLAVLFSYDYFHLFHLCLCDFIKNPENMNSQNSHFLVLCNKIK